MSFIEIIERSDEAVVVGPLEDLKREDLDFLASLPGCVEEVYCTGKKFERVAQINPRLMDPLACRILQVRSVVLLATVLQSHLKRKHHLKQLVQWLTQHPSTHKHEFWLRETEHFEEKPGPEVLEGEDLLYALHRAPNLVKEPDPLLDDPFFQDGMEQVLEEFFSEHINGEPILWLTQEVKT